MLNKRNIFIASLILVTMLVYGLVNPALTGAQGNTPATTNQWCKGVNIVFMPGGSPGSGFADVAERPNS